MGTHVVPPTLDHPTLFGDLAPYGDVALAPEDHEEIVPTQAELEAAGQKRLFSGLPPLGSLERKALAAAINRGQWNYRGDTPPEQCTK